LDDFMHKYCCGNALGGALVAVAQQPYGPWLLGVVALGLVAYGLFCLSQALYRRVVTR
jgi:Domain of Unknown Function (DUF1206)